MSLWESGRTAYWWRLCVFPLQKTSLWRRTYCVPLCTVSRAWWGFCCYLLCEGSFWCTTTTRFGILDVSETFLFLMTRPCRTVSCSRLAGLVLKTRDHGAELCGESGLQTGCPHLLPQGPPAAAWLAGTGLGELIVKCLRGASWSLNIDIIKNQIMYGKIKWKRKTLNIQDSSFPN